MDFIQKHIRNSTFRPALIVITTLWWVAAPCGRSCFAFTPVEYLPEILSTDIRPHSRLEISPDGTEMYWSGYLKGQGRTEWIFYSIREAGEWTPPEPVHFNDGLGNGPALNSDATKLFFGAERRLEPDGPLYTGIWYVERTATGWGDVNPVQTTLDTIGFAGRPSLAQNGNLYFLARGTHSDMPAVFKCTLENDDYSEPTILTGAFDGEIIMDPWIDPAERFVLLMLDDWSEPLTSFGSSDVFISFRSGDGSWGVPVNLGPEINTEHFDRSPSLSRDGRFLFFIRAEGDLFVESDAHFFRIRFLTQPPIQVQFSE